MKSLLKACFALLACAGLALCVPRLNAAPHLMENLGRGVVAVRTSDNERFISWRLLATDPADVAFNLYRTSGPGAPVRLNDIPLTAETHFLDTAADASQPVHYSVRAVVAGVEQSPDAGFTLPAEAPVQPYLRVPLQRPAGGDAYTYSPGDASVGDLDGDGDYELVVKWDPSNQQDNSNGGVTGNVLLDAYQLDGTHLWRIDLGINIRAGAHYTQYLVYDFDGDGRAELVCKTAPGTRDGTGAFIAQPGRFVGTPSAPVDHAADYRNAGGYILTGPEFFTVFDGQSGAELASANYVVPRNADPASADVSPWGDNYGNRVDRFLGGVAYLDGRRPSFLLARGYYTRAVVAAWDWRDGQLTQRWVFDTGHNGTPNPFANWRGQGAHSLTVGDVDSDGRDEIIYGAAAIDDDGRGLYSTQLGHGDALHLSDMNPTRPGLEVWMSHEDPSSYGSAGLEFRDAATGELIFGVNGGGSDVGRGVAGDIDPTHPGYELWGARGGLMSSTGAQISTVRPGQMNFMVWWDGDLLREILDDSTISKWDWTTSTASPLLSPPDVDSNNGTKATPALSADILGDWREEVIWRELSNDALRIYTTTTPTTHRLPTLMHDRQYRLAIAWQNVGYNQPPHPGYFLGAGMAQPPAAEVVTSLAQLPAQPPAVVSINRYDPVSASTAAGTLVYRVTFSTPVTGVDPSDFSVFTTGAAVGSVTAVSTVSPFSFDVTVGGITGTGGVRLDLNASGTGITGPGGAPVAGGFTSGQVYARATLAWLNPGTGGAWSTPANWDGGLVADGAGSLANFANLDLVAENRVLLDTPRTVGGIVFGDTDPATPAGWTLHGGGDPANTLTLDAASAVPALTVGALGSGAAVTLDVPLRGNEGLGKAGAGTLVLTQPIEITGPLSVGAGTLRLGAGSSYAAGTIAISGGGAVLDVAGSQLSTSANTTVNGGGTLLVSGGTANLGAVATANSANGLIRVTGGAFTATSVTLPRSSDGTPSFAFGFVVAGGDAAVNGPVVIGSNNSWGSMSVEGGSLAVAGPLTLGNQASGGRGGQLRVLGGSLTLASPEGLVLARRNNNVARASFTGGVTESERVQLGINETITGGSATLTLDGGTLLLGSGGIQAGGTGAFVVGVTLSSGVLGAKADWSTSLPATLPAGGAVVVSPEDRNGTARTITWAGSLSGAGGLVKRGGGTLVLAGANTYTGTTTVEAGELEVSGSLASPVVVRGGALVGSGTLSAPVTLHPDAVLGAQGSAADSVLTVPAVSWTGGARLRFILGTSGVASRLAVAGPLLRGEAGTVAVELRSDSPLVHGSTYTLATYGSTDLDAGDLVATGLPEGVGAVFTVSESSLSVRLVARPEITSPVSASGQVGEPFRYTLVATNEPDLLSVSGLPEGLSFDPTSGEISGVPLRAGTRSLVLRATNLGGTTTVALTLQVAKGDVVLTLANVTQAYDGSPRPVVVTTSPQGLSVGVTYDGASAPPTYPGTYDVRATVEDPDYAGTAVGRLEVTITALVRHAPTMNGDVDGSVQVLLPENITLNTGAGITGDLLVRGAPAVRRNGSGTFGGTLEGPGLATPTGYQVTLNSGTVLRHVVRRIDAIALPEVALPQPPAGTRNLALNGPGQSIGDPATLRDLTLNSKAGEVAIPPGAYGAFTANASSTLLLGSATAAEPSVYHLQALTLNSGARLRLVGPVVIRLGGNLVVNGTLGAPGHSLVVESRAAGATFNSGARGDAVLLMPNGTVTLNGATVRGRVSADRLVLNGNALLEEAP